MASTRTQSLIVATVGLFGFLLLLTLHTHARPFIVNSSPSEYTQFTFMTPILYT